MENCMDSVCDKASAGVAGKTLYLDCQAGIAGDMLVAALIDVAEDSSAAESAVRSALDGLDVDGFAIEVSRVFKASISCCDFNVVLDAAHENHDHDMAYLHGDHDHCHDHVHEDGEHHHVHAHEHTHGDDEHHHHHGDHAHGHHHGHEHHHHHEHRGLADIERIIAASSLSASAQTYALKAFRILAEAEAKAHAVPLDQVHFHEVGAVDSIVDVLATAVLVDYLGITKTVVPVLVDGHGTIRCQHGVIPVPAPATLNICTPHGLPLGACDVEGELVTPTGAALVAALEPSFELPESYRVIRAGMGAGKRSYSRPSILRAMAIESIEQQGSAVNSLSKCVDGNGQPMQDVAPFSAETEAPIRVVKLEADLDDATGEQLAYAADCLLAAGAREAHWLPIFTKKGRPAYQLQVICTPEDVDRLERIIFMETTTTGVRRSTWDRTVLPRERVTVDTPFGPITVKRATLPDGTVRIKPEHDDCARAARSAQVPLQDVVEAARRAATTVAEAVASGTTPSSDASSR